MRVLPVRGLLLECAIKRDDDLTEGGSIWELINLGHILEERPIGDTM